MQQLLSRHWHHLPDDEVLDLLDTDVERGLDTFEVEDRQERFGRNELTPKKSQSALVKFLKQFNQPLIYILLVAGTVTALLKGAIDASVIFGVVLINAVIGFLQESKAIKAIEALARSMTTEATVLRHGERSRVPAAQLVPGDVVLLQSGDKVPADLRLLRTRELQIDESTLTGESLPVAKTSEPVEEEAILADRHDMAYSSTLVTYGTGTGVVTAIGDETEIGRISQMIASAESLETPLTQRITRFSKVLLWVILALATATFLVGLLLRGQPAVDTFLAAVALTVAVIPEGLPAVVTITLAIGVSRMARSHAIVRNLPAIETLGSTTVICSDKTGTLTQNQMTVQVLFAAGQRYEVLGSGYTPEGAIEQQGRPAPLHAALRECLSAGVLCNDSQVRGEGAAWRVEGDPTEGALLVSARKAGLDPDALRLEQPRLDAIPFESQFQYMATLHRASGERRVAYLKGSIEQLLARCVDRLDARGERVALDPAGIAREVDALASRGLRVLAFARRELPEGRDRLDHQDVAELTFLGLQAMLDPPRPEAMDAVASCQRAGIAVKMITGDHPATAAAIAQRLALAGEGVRPEVLTGRDLMKLSDEQLIGAAERTAVFARVTPEQKLRLVEALQSRGQIVAMTGDGVNDASALRRANIGVAMGVSGTEVAKEAADMVLTDDNFASIERAVEEGRSVFANLMKFITWILPTNVGQGLVILVAVVAGIDLPILPVQILWINMTTALFLGLMLAFEPKEPGIMLQPPREPSAPILTGALVLRILVVSALLLIGSFGLFEWMVLGGASLEAARAVAVNVFALGQTFYLFNCRSLDWSAFKIGFFSNPWALGGAAAMIAVQLAFTYLPAMNWVFHTSPFGWQAWLLILADALLIYLVTELEKWLRRRRGKREPLPNARLVRAWAR